MSDETSLDDEVCREYRIRGNVQGVGFRWWTRKNARALGLRGWVKNESDGSVHIQVAGEEGSVDRFADRLRKGPPRARVQEVEEDEGRGAGPLFEGFEIIR